MRKALLILLFAVAAVVGTAALATRADAAKGCPKGERPVRCPYGIICCRAHDPVYCSCY